MIVFGIVRNNERIEHGYGFASVKYKKLHPKSGLYYKNHYDDMNVITGGIYSQSIFIY